ncbi:Polysaccharide deacetylase [Chitinophaga sp. YR573]|uniref:polysaccharide deacetylase family protein n=1 Tax=Chitinophaga sp. YR573 TaxID=1881040 RepID=UPI0008AAB5FE|nr:polysaccharide deacetylase family protein [Chitinophaga sp. YR573]SEW40630.1 Polysaccharide deacetylase [Chitinophaga sp. YR573]
MSLAKNAFYSAVQLLPIKMLQNGGLLLPYHHLVSNKDVPHIKHLYPFKNIRAFEQDLDYLLKHFTPVTLQDVITAVTSGQPLPARSFLITFDDGLREITENIAPLLLKKGVPAAFFLNSAFLDNKELFYKFKVSLIIEAIQTGNHSAAALAKLSTILGNQEELIPAIKRISYHNRQLAEEVGAALEISFTDYLKQQRPFMTLDEVGKLVQQGFAIGGHSVDHPYYSQLTLEEQLTQTRDSVNFLTEHFHIPYRAFAFPHTDAGVSRTFFETILEGPDPIDVIFGTANHKRDISPRILHRFNCERPAVSIGAAVKGILLYNRLQELRNKQVIVR